MVVRFDSMLEQDCRHDFSVSIDPHPTVFDGVLPLVFKNKGKSIAYSDKQYFNLKTNK